MVPARAPALQVVSLCDIGEDRMENGRQVVEKN